MGMKFCTTFLLVKLALFVDLAAPELARSLPKRGLPIFNRDAVLLEVREEWQRRDELRASTETPLPSFTCAKSVSRVSVTK